MKSSGDNKRSEKAFTVEDVKTQTLQWTKKVLESIC